MFGLQLYETSNTIREIVASNRKKFTGKSILTMSYVFKLQSYKIIKIVFEVKIFVKLTIFEIVSKCVYIFKKWANVKQQRQNQVSV